MYARSHGNGCPACRGYVATASTSLMALNPALAVEWHPELNGKLTPQTITPNSNKTAWWTCPTCTHTWAATIASRAAQGNGCPACNGKVATRETSLATLFPALAGQWHQELNAPLTPSDVTPGSNKKFYWTCDVDVCGHVWSAYVMQRTRGEGCPSCSGRVATPTNCLQTLRPDLASQWHPTLNDRGSAQVTAGSAHAAWWLGPECGHEWQAAVYARVAGNGCPACWASIGESRQETQLREHLATYLPLDLVRRVRRTDGRRAGPWKVDILCSQLMLIIEFDGSYWHGPKFPAQLVHDQTKADYLRAQGYTVIRIREAPLTPLHPDDVTVPYLADPVDVACIVLTHLRELGIQTSRSAA